MKSHLIAHRHTSLDGLGKYVAYRLLIPWLYVGLALAVLSLYVTFSLQDKRAIALSRTIAQNLDLPRDLADRVHLLARAPGTALRKEFIFLTARVLTAIGLLMTAGAIIGLLLQAALRFLMRTDPIPWYEIRHENRLANAIILVGSIALLLLLSGAIAVNEARLLSDLLLLLPALLFASGIIAVLFVYISVRLIRRTPEARHEFALHETDPYRKLSLYTDLLPLLCVIWFFAVVTVPWIFGQLHNFPQKFTERSMTALATLEAGDFRQRVVGFVRSQHLKSSDPNSEREADEAVKIAEEQVRIVLTFHHELADRITAIIRAKYRPETLAMAKARIQTGLALAFGLIFLFASFKPWVVTAYASGGLQTLCHRGAAVRRPVLAVLPALIVAFILDRLGVSTDRPTLWLVVMATVVVCDTVLTTPDLLSKDRVLVVPGGNRYHLSDDCGALSQTPSDKLKRVLRKEALALGLTICKLCAGNSSNLGKLVWP